MEKKSGARDEGECRLTLNDELMREAIGEGSGESGKAIEALKKDTWRARFELHAALGFDDALHQTLSRYHQSYDCLPDDIKARCSWEDISGRLLAGGVVKLKQAAAMQGGGELFGIDREGRALIKDKGVEPVMYGFNEDGKLMQIFDRDPEQMGKVQEWADYPQIRGKVRGDGYELFTDDGYGFPGDEVRQVTENTGQLFVASERGDESRASWLESGREPAFLARMAHFHPLDRLWPVSMCDGFEWKGRDWRGAVRLLRV